MHFLIIILSIAGCIGSLTPSSPYDDNPDDIDPLQVDPPGPGIPWPYPQEMQISQDLMTLNPTEFTIMTNADDCDIVRAALNRYRNLIFLTGNKEASDRSIRLLFSLEVIIDNYKKNYCEYPALGDDETYTISMTYEDQTAHLKAKTVWGALRGLETFSQLVHFDDKTKTYRINVTNIKDQPRFSYRGVLIDTAKHYLPTDLLKLNLDAMAYNKLNVFHWHIVDDESFPLQSLMYPNLTTLGAFSRNLIYTQAEIKEVVAYARLRGIRVIPEFDTPAHTKAMGLAFPHLMTPCRRDRSQEGQSKSMSILNPTLDLTYHVLEEILKELKTLFPDEYIHLGMNDITPSCLDDNPSFSEYKVLSKMRDGNSLGSYYATKVISIATNVGFKPMVWQDVIEAYPMNWSTMKNVVVQVRKDPTINNRMEPWFNYAQQFSEKDYKLIISSCWNFNYPIYGEELRNYYDCDPGFFLRNCDKCYKEVLEGGEAVLWGDLVDSTNLISRLWPGASAMAERLWSSSKQNKFYEAVYRLDQQRCLMRQRGIAAGPVMSGHCGDIDRNSTLYVTSFQSPNYDKCSNACNCSKECNCTKRTDNTTKQPSPSNSSSKGNASDPCLKISENIHINSSGSVNEGNFVKLVIQFAAVMVTLQFSLKY